MIRLESIGSVSRKLSSVRRNGGEITVTDECPEHEQIQQHLPEDWFLGKTNAEGQLNCPVPVWEP